MMPAFFASCKSEPSISEYLIPFARTRAMTKLVSVQPADLPDQTGGPVADDAVPHLLADGNPDPVFSQFIAAHINDQVPVRKGSSFRIAFFKICVFFQRFHFMV